MSKGHQWRLPSAGVEPTTSLQWVLSMAGIVLYLFGVLHRFQHCTGHITTGSWKGRGNQNIQFVRVLYCKLLTNGKQLPAFPLEANWTPASEVGGKSVTTLPPWLPGWYCNVYTINVWCHCFKIHPLLATIICHNWNMQYLYGRLLGVIYWNVLIKNMHWHKG